MALNLGGIIRLTYTVKDDVGAAANPSAATLTITQPDLTLAAGIVVDITPAVTGSLVYDFAPVQAGLHSVHWATTGPATAEDDVFTVETPGRMLVSVDEAVNHLRAAGVITSAADRETLQSLCLAATDAVERDLGRIIVRRSVTEDYDGGAYCLILRSTPVASVTSVVDSGVTLGITDYTLDAGSGILFRGTGNYSTGFTSGRQSVTVTYVAGYSAPPHVVRLAALNVVQGMWQASQQAPHTLLEDGGMIVSAVAAMDPRLQQAYDSLRAVGVA